MANGRVTPLGRWHTLPWRLAADVGSRTFPIGVLVPMLEARSGPDFIVIGAQKSASTFLQHCLQAHPDIFLPEGETPYFEDPDYAQTPSAEFQSLFMQRPERLLGIKRPNYIGRPEVPPRILNDLPRCKLIAVLRQPVDRAVSSYFHQIKYGTLPPLDVEVGLRRILQADPSFVRAHPRAQEVLEFGLYAKYLDMYRPFIEAGQMLTLLHEDVVRQPLVEVRRVLAFLDASTDFVPPNLDARPQKVVYSIPRLRFLAKRNKHMYAIDASRTRLHRRRLSAFEYMFVGAITAIDRVLLARVFRSEKPVLSAGLRTELSSYYARDVEQLSRLIGRDLSHWSSGTTP